MEDMPELIYGVNRALLHQKNILQITFQTISQFPAQHHRKEAAVRQIFDRIAHEYNLEAVKIFVENCRNMNDSELFSRDQDVDALFAVGIIQNLDIPYLAVSQQLQMIVDPFSNKISDYIAVFSRLCQNKHRTAFIDLKGHII